MWVDKVLQCCSKKCQIDHWPRHREDCNHELLRDDWMPTWHRENRSPVLDFPMIHQASGHMKHLWGNVPAYDVLQLEKNEGLDHAEDLSLCFGGISSVPQSIQESN